MASYAPGDRVWVYIEGDGWWPARVLSDEEIGARTPGQDIAVHFYAGIDTPASLYELNSHSEAAHICFFETSSEKAVTSSAELEASIRHAAEDATANPLKSDSAISASAAVAAAAATTGAGGAPGGASTIDPTAAVTRAAAKRMREMDDVDMAGSSGDGGAAAATMSDAGFRHLRTDDLHRLSEKIAAAVEAHSLTKVRAALCQLDGVDVYLTELEETKIGIAVGSVLSQPSLKPLWPLARAIVSFWSRHLPAETLAAIRTVKQQDISATGKSGVEPGSPNEPSSPVGATQSPLRKAPAPGSPGVAGGGSAFDHVGSPSAANEGTPLPPKSSSFLRHVRQRLDNPDNSVRYDDAVVEEVARRIAADITDFDDRQLLLVRLGEPDMEFLRMKLLSGEWTPRKYLEQPNEIFLTEKQKSEEAQRVANKMKAIEAAANAGVNLTHLFKCERCGKRDCTFYELQIRGADEPTTKYITCLNCKNSWSQE
ncbi:transcription elongation factor-like protein [Leptomonas pyrrhocoris]|uniref:Transcription elongation factor-like protein n=1 Tax=Leptomonas pyrrhocoris TaxID=157538 RepID=A0A0M9G835_LEPPY|nr:transcription elongation factor-like protein [Leptomonas pyrrhocoris]KPA84369.1 transcription elongation factor-like protein [Leptomonas pyrrhocoris]|eukprot:XP_015662808.1 transcription elongation factor-like protein [Leptomonas pyrrhocoris]